MIVPAVDPVEAASLPAERLRAIAEAACTAAATVIVESRHHHALHTKSTHTDIVTATDLAAERRIVETITAAAPGSRVLAEEGGHIVAGHGPHGDVEWLVDPLDGTVNFAYRIPISAVSVAAVVGGRPVAGAVVDTGRAETFSAHLGGGAMLDGQPIQVGGCDDLSLALVATGFSYQADRRLEHGRTVSELLGIVRDIRAFGSAALHLCWVAAARVDLYVERDIKPWDYAAGSLVATEAGATIELPCSENRGLVLASNRVLGDLIRPHLT